jgi:pimeloyl-ACP methyl ester carboxylesterase
VAADPFSVQPGVREAHLQLARERATSAEGERALIQAARGLARLLMRRNLAATYESVRAPVLVLHGERDRLVPVEFSLEIGSRYGWQVEVLPGVGHVPMLEAPARFLDVTLGWLDGALQAAV